MGKAQKRKLERKLARQNPTTEMFLTDSLPAMHQPPDRATWPVIRAYVPLRDAWCATGYGTAGLIRQGPGGKCSYAFFTISLHREGIVSMFGKDHETRDKAEKTPQELREDMPPFEEGPPELAADYIYGAWGLGLLRGQAWPDDQVRRFLGLVTRPSGDQSQWAARLTGPDGLTPPELCQVLAANPEPPDLPDGKEIMILTTMTYALSDTDAVLRGLRSAGPTFLRSGQKGEAEEMFAWTRAFPKGHTSPLAKGGHRQVLGDVKVRPGVLVAQAQTLSMAAKLISILHRVLGQDHLSLQHTAWKSAQDMLAAIGR